MERFKFYTKELAILLAVYGSAASDAQKQYQDFMEQVKSRLPKGIEIRMSFTSREVLNKFDKKYYSPVQQLAALDREGYKKVVVASVNLFPADEHNYLIEVVNGFRNISYAKYELTDPLLTKTRCTNEFLRNLDKELRAHFESRNIVYIAHGSPNLDAVGAESFLYIRGYLNELNHSNYFHCIDGVFPFRKEVILQDIEERNAVDKDVLFVPLFMVTGNHFKNDIHRIKEDLSIDLDSLHIAENFQSEGGFAILKYPRAIDYYIQQIKEAIEKLNW